MAIFDDAAGMAMEVRYEPEHPARPPASQLHGGMGGGRDASGAVDAPPKPSAEARPGGERFDRETGAAHAPERNRWGDLVGQWRSCRM